MEWWARICILDSISWDLVDDDDIDFFFYERWIFETLLESVEVDAGVL